MTKLYDIIREAEHQVDEYKHPNLDEFREAIDPILSALGQCTIGGDHVKDISINSAYVSITTSYSCRGCSNDNDMTIPIDVIEAEDPVRFATERTLRNKLHKTVTELNAARARIPKLEEISQAAAMELAEFLKK